MDLIWEWLHVHSAGDRGDQIFAADLQNPVVGHSLRDSAFSSGRQDVLAHQLDARRLGGQPSVKLLGTLEWFRLD